MKFDIPPPIPPRKGSWRQFLPQAIPPPPTKALPPEPPSRNRRLPPIQEEPEQFVPVPERVRKVFRDMGVQVQSKDDIVKRFVAWLVVLFILLFLCAIPCMLWVTLKSDTCGDEAMWVAFRQEFILLREEIEAANERISEAVNMTLSSTMTEPVKCEPPIPPPPISSPPPTPPKSEVPRKERRLGDVVNSVWNYEEFYQTQARDAEEFRGKLWDMGKTAAHYVGGRILSFIDKLDEMDGDGDSDEF